MVQKAVQNTAIGLGIMALCMFIFICWWFPRAWSKGNAIQNREWDEINRRRRLAEAEEAETDVELAGWDGKNTDVSKVVRKPQATYVPPVVSY